MVAADMAVQRLGERDRTALIALAGVIISLGVWVLWAWVSAVMAGRHFAGNDVGAEAHRIARERLSGAGAKARTPSDGAIGKGERGVSDVEKSTKKDGTAANRPLE